MISIWKLFLIIIVSTFQTSHPYKTPLEVANLVKSSSSHSQICVECFTFYSMWISCLVFEISLTPGGHVQKNVDSKWPPLPWQRHTQTYNWRLKNYKLTISHHKDIVQNCCLVMQSRYWWNKHCSAWTWNSTLNLKRHISLLFTKINVAWIKITEVSWNHGFTSIHCWMYKALIPYHY